MMQTRLSLFAVFLLLLASCGQENRVQPLVDDVRSDMAPDKRVALWEIEATSTRPTVLRGKTNLPEAREMLLSRLDSLQIDYIDSIQLLPDPALPASWGIVTLSVCNIRSQPKHSAELSTQCTMGQALRIYEAENADWFRVQTPDGYFGWLDAGGFRFVTDAEIAALNQLEKFIFLPEYGFAYADRTEESTPVSDLLCGNLVFGIPEQETNDYTRIYLPSGDTAFIAADQLMDYQNWKSQTTAEANAENLLQEASRLLGRPYLWGGTSGKGMDCSGFTKEVFARNGMILPRDASQQVHTGREIQTDTVQWSNLERGDLLFFGRKATAEQSERITHVAIYLGEGRIIHSSGSVKTESLVAGRPDYAPQRVASFVRAKRMLGERIDLPGSFQSPF